MVPSSRSTRPNAAGLIVSHERAMETREPAGLEGRRIQLTGGGTRKCRIAKAPAVARRHTHHWTLDPCLKNTRGGLGGTESPPASAQRLDQMFCAHCSEPKPRLPNPSYEFVVLRGIFPVIARQNGNGTIGTSFITMRVDPATSGGEASGFVDWREPKPRMWNREC